MKALKSPYSKMYLVTTSVYDKLLTCLDEKEKKSTELLNIAKQKEERPGEKVIGEITSGDFEPVVTQEQQPIEMQPEIVEEIPICNVDVGNSVLLDHKFSQVSFAGQVCFAKSLITLQCI